MSLSAEMYEISMPYGIKHDLHIHYNFKEARFEGVPSNFLDFLGPNHPSLRTSASSSSSAASISSSNNNNNNNPTNTSTTKKKNIKRARSFLTKQASQQQQQYKTIADSLLFPVVNLDRDPCSLINQHFQLHYRHVPRLQVTGYQDRIPAVLVMLKEYFFFKNGQLIPHIFRESPSKEARDQAIEEINHGMFQGDQHDVRILADLIKVWFRELPMPILHQIPPEEMERLVKQDRVMEEINSFLGILEKNIIYWLADLLVIVAENQSVNHMGIEQLAIIIAPNLVRIVTENPMVAVTASKAAVDLFRCILYTRKQEIIKTTQV